MFFKTVLTFQLVLAIGIINAQSSITTLLPSLQTSLPITTNSENCTEFSTTNKKWITFSNKTSFCYYVTNDDKRVSYHEALDICQSMNGTLASIHDIQINYLLSHRDFGGADSSDYWIGLNSLTKRGVYKWTDRTPLQFTNFTTKSLDGGQIPTDPLEQGRCVSIRSEKISTINKNDLGAWFKDDCYTQLKFICERKQAAFVEPTPTPNPDSDGNCMSDWYLYPGQKCVKYFDLPVNITVAKAICRTYNGDVLSIHSEQENDYITALTGGKNTAYIGLQINKHKWQWDDQSKVSYTNWGQYNADSGECSVIGTNQTSPGNWLRTECNRNYSFVCQMALEPRIIDPGVSLGTIKCKIPGFENFVEYRNSCYALVDSPTSKFTNFFAAESNCQSIHGSHLVSIVDPFEHSFLKYLVKEYGKSDIYWTGLKSDPDYDKNISQIFEWTDDWPVYYTYWDRNEPQFAGLPGAECVALWRANSTWKTTVCDAAFAYICKTTTIPLPKMNTDKSGVCPHLNGVTDPKFSWVDLDKRNRYCYWFSIDLKDPSGNGLMSWSDASFHCHRRNGTLVSIHSPHELMLLRAKLSQPDSAYTTWIGLYKDPNGNYVWEDGSALDYTNWDPNEKIVLQTIDLNDNSGHQCVESTSRTLMWKQEPCAGTKRGYFICQAKKLYTQTSVTQYPRTTPPLNTLPFFITNATKGTTHLRTSTTQMIKGSTTTPKPMNTSALTSTTAHVKNGSTNEPVVTTASPKRHSTSTLTPTEGSTNKPIGDKPSDSEKGLSSGAKAGIAFGTIGGIVIVVGITYLLLKKFRPNSSIVETVENSLYLRERTLDDQNVSVRWSKRT